MLKEFLTSERERGNPNGTEAAEILFHRLVTPPR
jgi:hypothetical protein